MYASSIGYRLTIDIQTSTGNFGSAHLGEELRNSTLAIEHEPHERAIQPVQNTSR
jgi:hypothetical protein